MNRLGSWRRIVNEGGFSAEVELDLRNLDERVGWCMHGCVKCQRFGFRIQSCATFLAR